MSTDISKFEVGKSYGNGRNSLSRKVIARTACYVTFEGGMRKRIHVITKSGETTEYVQSKLLEFCVFASELRSF